MAATWKRLAFTTELHNALTLGDAAIQAVLDLSGQALTLDSQAANTALRGPASGAAAAPTFRAAVEADVAAHNILTKHSYTGGAALDVFGLSAVSTLAKLTPDSDVYNETAEKLLKADADGGFRADHAEFGNIAGAAEGQIAVAKSIIFPATQVPDAGANVLDDYEEGTWEGAFVCGTSGTITINATTKTGTYTKIGRLVAITGHFNVSSVSSPVGSLTLTGLPFTAQNAASARAAVAVRAASLNATAATVIQGFINMNTTAIVFEHFAAGVAANMAADMKAGSDLFISGVYVV